MIGPNFGGTLEYGSVRVRTNCRKENWMGRPKMDNRKTRTVKVRMTEEDYNMFTYLCDKTNKTKSDLFRIALLEYMERVKKWY